MSINTSVHLYGTKFDIKVRDITGCISLEVNVHGIGFINIFGTEDQLKDIALKINEHFTHPESLDEQRAWDYYEDPSLHEGESKC